MGRGTWHLAYRCLEAMGDACVPVSVGHAHGLCTPCRVPHWSGCGSGAWRGPRHWRRPCCSPRAHTHTASPQCGTAGVSSGSPGESRPSSSPQTGKRRVWSESTPDPMQEPDLGLNPAPCPASHLLHPHKVHTGVCTLTMTFTFHSDYKIDIRPV